jgi:bifunctional DNA-binding transcriptional regulator/antitoxin component of YhaV-PrlF toxin-antitoxin module
MTTLPFAPAKDRNGVDLKPGDRVSFGTYPSGHRQRGVIVVSAHWREVMRDGGEAPALAIDSGGTIYSLTSSALKLKGQ